MLQHIHEADTISLSGIMSKECAKKKQMLGVELPAERVAQDRQ
jgi:hypothetical protein